jgi:hypothetical protein
VITYDRRAFAVAYVEARMPAIGGVDAERDGYGPALLEHRAVLLAGLERLLGLRLEFGSVPDGMGALLMLLRSTARSCSAITAPGAGFLEASLLHQRLEQVGVHDVVLRDLDRITALNAESRAVHLDLLDTLFAVLLMR